MLKRYRDIPSNLFPDNCLPLTDQKSIDISGQRLFLIDNTGKKREVWRGSNEGERPRECEYHTTNCNSSTDKATQILFMQTIKSKMDSSIPRWHDTPQIWALRTACINNSIDLILEAKILYRHKKYARAVTLAYTAYEEFGKAQLVSDYIAGVASEKEIREAFKSHGLKTAYNKRKIVISENKVSPPTASVEYDRSSAQELLKMRMDSLYVDCADDFTPSIPNDKVNSIIAKETINGIEGYMKQVLWAEKFTGRIGTKALAK